MLNRITCALQSSNLLGATRTGFRPQLSSQNSLVLINNELFSESRKKNPKVLLAVDIRKAFYTVPHDTTLSAVKCFNLGNNVTPFIYNFLTERKFEIAISSWNSTEYTNNLGVPQGSVISPALFNFVMSKHDKELSTIP